MTRSLLLILREFTRPGHLLISNWGQFKNKAKKYGRRLTSSLIFIFVKCWRNVLKLNPQRPYLGLEGKKGNFCVVFSYFIKRACEIRKFHVAFVQRRLRNVQKTVMHLQSCCFALLNLNYCLLHVFVAVAVVVAQAPYCCNPEILLPWLRDVTRLSIT